MWLTNTGKKSRLNINKTKKLQRVLTGAATPTRTLISEDSTHYPQRLSEIFCLKHGVIKSYHEASRISRTFGLCYAIRSPFLLPWHKYRLQGRYARWSRTADPLRPQKLNSNTGENTKSHWRAMPRPRSPCERANVLAARCLMEMGKVKPVEYLVDVSTAWRNISRHSQPEEKVSCDLR